MNRTHKISFRVSDYERKLVQSKVKKSGIRMSDFCRHAVLGKEIRTFKGLDKCSYELNKIGNNLNQLTVLCHQRAVQNPNLETMQIQLSAVLELIYMALGGDDDGYSQTD
ncbi:plasmid mobilization protein [Cellulosilyticum lentocellum]|uniref:Putative mobilization protein n=1 Tax=Cellulosilyticum lentocellum (strain ATCC 49066 / DSM 5427 / NCIMB 11756 / RHM5) TaxID=642492 RepID=F2JPB8_CELLD|nr:plasmid mobilization relaxosome protein MobC [Cellulosilyticum lentocellum]ADZ84857.1 putative mobilization protein [Cellulosilyticum lentocellum DSM 5427]